MSLRAVSTVPVLAMFLLVGAGACKGGGGSAIAENDVPEGGLRVDGGVIDREGGDPGEPPVAGDGGAPPTSAEKQVAYELKAVDVGSKMEWKDRGFNIDGLCSVAGSTDTCKLVAGAQKSTSLDGINGNDNSFGKNVIPIFDAFEPNAAVRDAILITDAAGAGTLYWMSQTGALRIPVRNARVDAASRKLSAVIFTTGLEASIQEWAGQVSADLCAGSTIDGLKASIRQASDIMVDGTQDPTQTCDGISFGATFASATPGAVAPEVPVDPCK